MAIKFYERPDSRELKLNAYTTKWGASNTNSEGEVWNTAFGATPTFVSGPNGLLYRQDIEVRPVGYELWEVTIPYGPLTRAGASPQNEMKWSFDTTGGTATVRHSLETQSSYPSGTAPDFKRAINVEGEEVRGTEITIPVMRLTVSFTYPLGILTLYQAKAIAGITGTINSAAFLTFAPGEVLFLGGTGSDGTVTATTITYQFAVSPAVAGLTIGDITGINKPGWSYLWVKFKGVDDATGTPTYVKQPEFVFVERVYNAVNFAGVLGFG